MVDQTKSEELEHVDFVSLRGIARLTARDAIDARMEHPSRTNRMNTGRRG